MYGTDHSKEIGKRIQKIRGSRDQRTFAENIDSVQQTISKYERGEIPRSWLFLARLAAEENVDLNDLLGEAAAGPRRSGNHSESRRSRTEKEYETVGAGANGGTVHA